MDIWVVHFMKWTILQLGHNIYTGVPGDIQQSYETLKALLAELGLKIGSSKLISPTAVAICLGIEINMVY